MFSHASLSFPIQERYQKARRFIRHVTASSSEERLVFNGNVKACWLGKSDAFYYQSDSAEGTHFRYVDVIEGMNKYAFDHSTLAATLSEIAGETVSSNQLPIYDLVLNVPSQRVTFSAFGSCWEFDGESCVQTSSCVASQRERVSPNGDGAIFVRDHNLWLRSLNEIDSVMSQERQLSYDGEEHYAYGSAPNMVAAGQDLGVLGELQVLWSPDSKRLLAVQLDMRQVESLPVVHYVPEENRVRPALECYKYPMPGDTHVPQYRMVAIDIESGEIIPADYPSISFSFLIPFFTGQRAWWSSDCESAYFVDLKRGGQHVQVMEFNTISGATRVLFEENSDTWINLHPTNYHGPSLVMPLPETNELIWYSERSGWAHLYLYDLKTGILKNAITQGDWVVREILRFDINRRELWIQTAGRVAGRDPYYKDICRVHVDSGDLTTVVSSDHDYVVASEESSIDLRELRYGVSPSAEYVVTTRTRADEAPATLLLDRHGKEVMLVAKADISRLSKAWTWPEPVSLKAADGETDIYGLVFRPSYFSADKSYPIIDCAFAYPSGALTCKQFDLGHHYMYSAALAELGFIVVQLDGRGTAMRSRKFLDYSDGALTSASSLKDHVAGLKQLAERYPYMDLDRVGAFGGWTTSAFAINALLQCPKIFKVGVTSGMPQSQLYMANCSEPFEGPNHGQTSFVQPEYLAENLQGKLLMIHGMLDILDVPAATFRMVEAFQKANKDFDLLLLPNQKHGSGWANPYIARRILDFFVRHLLNEEPPSGFDLTVRDK